MKTRILLFVFSCLLVISASQKAQAQMAVTTCGQTLDVAGGEYVLMNDLNCSAPAGDFDGVRITASNVKFHLAGHKISSPVCDQSRNVTGIFVVGGLTNVKVDGGDISGFNDGIQLSASNSSVKGMTVTGACAAGIGVQGANNLVANNIARGNVDGILLVSTASAVVRCNTLTDNSRAGIAVSGENTTDNLIEENIINGSDNSGIAVFNGTNTIIRNNALKGNQNGIFIDSANSRVRDNIVSGSTDVGINVTINGSPSVVRFNTVFGSGATDMTDDSAACGGNIWRNNSFISDRVNGIPNGGPSVACLR